MEPSGFHDHLRHTPRRQPTQRHRHRRCRRSLLCAHSCLRPRLRHRPRCLNQPLRLGGGGCRQLLGEPQLQPRFRRGAPHRPQGHPAADRSAQPQPVHLRWRCHHHRLGARGELRRRASGYRHLPEWRHRDRPRQPRHLRHRLPQLLPTASRRQQPLHPVRLPGSQLQRCHQPRGHADRQQGRHYHGADRLAQPLHLRHQHHLHRHRHRGLRRPAPHRRCPVCGQRHFRLVGNGHPGQRRGHVQHFRPTGRQRLQHRRQLLG